jgi:DNA (cytosine-5)-methyltransferase 1
MDHRYLWPEALRIVYESEPRWVIFENVTNFESVGLGDVVSDLERLSFEVVPPLEIPACAVGLDHWRPRLWICGHSDRNRKSSSTIDEEMAGVQENRPFTDYFGKAHGLSRRLDGYRRSALGNAVVPKIPEIIGCAILAAEAA